MIAHSFRGELFGPAQRLHGATYVVDVELRRPSSTRAASSSTSAAPRDTLRALLGELSFRNLDELPEFAGKNTTTEFVARWILRQRMADAAVAGALGPGSTELPSIKVTLHESHVAWASYERELARTWLTARGAALVGGGAPGRDARPRRRRALRVVDVRAVRSQRGSHAGWRAGSRPTWRCSVAALCALRVALALHRRAGGRAAALSARRRDYYLSTLLNQLLPLGVAGDVVRALRHRRRLGAQGTLGPPARAVVLERLSGVCGLALFVVASARSWLAPAGDVALGAGARRSSRALLARSARRAGRRGGRSTPGQRRRARR